MQYVCVILNGGTLYEKIINDKAYLGKNLNVLTVIKHPSNVTCGRAKSQNAIMDSLEGDDDYKIRIYFMVGN